jgi:hypothetical protein
MERRSGTLPPLVRIGALCGIVAGFGAFIMTGEAGIKYIQLGPLINVCCFPNPRGGWVAICGLSGLALGYVAQWIADRFFARR